MFYLRVPLTRSWAPGETRTFYFRSMFASLPVARIRCLPFRAHNAGIVCAGARRGGAGGRYSVALRLRNGSGAAISPSAMPEVRLGVQVGP